MPSAEMSAADLVTAGAVATALVLGAFAAKRDLGAPLKIALPALLAAAVSVIGLALALELAWRPIALFAALLMVSATIAEIDRRSCLIPDPLVAGLFALALAAPLGVHWSLALQGAALLGALFLGIRALFAAAGQHEALGLGDVKLAAAMGALLGPYDALLAVALAGVATLSVAIPATRIAGRTNSQIRIPFGIGLAAALVAVAAFRLAAPL